MSRDRPDDATPITRTTSRRRYLGAVGGAAVATALGTSATSSAQSEPTDGLAGQQWEQVWSDEFDASVDRDTWSFEVGNGHDQGIPGWGNEELQYYSDGDNASVEDGRLVIEAREEQASDEHGTYDYTSSRMLTRGNRTFQYGRIDVRATLPEGQGIWPAIWLLGSNIDEVDWPDCGEIDLMELVGDQPDTVHGTVHGPGYSAGEAIGGAYALDAGRFSEGPHTFSIVWEPDRIQWFVDGEQYFQVTRADVEARGAEWVFDGGPFYLLLNVAVGGQWPGYPDETTEFPQRMTVEYVRRYEAVEEPSPCTDAAGGSADVDGQTVCDVNGDGLFRDVNGDGEMSQADVTDFFEVQHRSAWKQPSLFDFDESGEVGHGDVIALFEDVARQV